MALGISREDRVAVTTYSWPATANVIALLGAEPIFVEIDGQTFNMDPAALEQTLKHVQVKVVLPVHTFGAIADMSRIVEIAGRHGASVVEDAACAFGAQVDGKRAGTWGIMGCFSFHPRKAITTGEGGIVTTNDQSLARRLKILRNHGQDPDSPSPDFIEAGYNMRLTEFQAALGVTQMGKVERIIESRRVQATRYDQLLANTGVRAQQALNNSRHVYQSYVGLLPQEAALHRREMISALKQMGIETTIGTYHMPLTSYFSRTCGFKSGDFPVTDDVAQRSISLPMFEALTEQHQTEVIDRLVQVMDSVSVLQ
jgi:dTDP-4-amino-4,6-dideoxygalactose transaminase